MVEGREGVREFPRFGLIGDGVQGRGIGMWPFRCRGGREVGEEGEGEEGGRERD